MGRVGLKVLKNHVKLINHRDVIVVRKCLYILIVILQTCTPGRNVLNVIRKCLNILLVILQTCTPGTKLIIFSVLREREERRTCITVVNLLKLELI